MALSQDTVTYIRPTCDDILDFSAPVVDGIANTGLWEDQPPVTESHELVITSFGYLAR